MKLHVHRAGAIKQLHIKKSDKLSAEKQSLNKLGIKELDSGRLKNGVVVRRGIAVLPGRKELAVITK